MIERAAYDGRHLEDGDVIRLLDGECPPEETREFDSHLGTCDECRHKMDELTLLSRQFGSALELADEPAASGEANAPQVIGTIRPSEARVHWTRWRITRAAAAIALIVAAVAASPARAWLVERWHDLKSLVVGSPVEQPETTPVSVLPGEPASVVTFTPTGSDFTLRFAHAQSGGTLYLTVEATASASAGIVDGDGTEEIVVLSDGFQIRNRATSSASYRVRLPNRLSTITLQIGDIEDLVLDLAAETGPISQEIDLSGANRVLP